MKFEIEKADFVRILQKMQNIVEKRSAMPILANVLLIAKDNKLTVFATDLEVSLRDEAPAKVSKEGEIAVSGKNLHELVRELEDRPVTVTKKENSWLEVKSNKAVFNIVGAAAEEFPAFPKYEAKDEIKIQSEVLRDMIEKTLYSVSHDETKYHLNGVYFERIPSGQLTTFRMVATDGHRLSLVEKTLDIAQASKSPAGVIIPRKGLQELKKLIEGVEGTISLTFEGSHLIAKTQTAVLLVRLIDGKYPNYQQLIPTRLMRRLAVSKENMLSSLRRVSLLSNQKSKGITLSISKGNMEIFSNNPELGDAKEELDIKYAGEGIKIGFNAKYLMDILTNIHDEEIDIELNDQLSPGILRPGGDTTYTCVVMPMRI